MKPTVLIVAVMLAVSACGGAAEETTTTVPPTGMAAVDACIAAIADETSGIDLGSEGATGELEAILGVEGPAVCAFFWADDPAAAVGVSDEELLKAIVDGLPADLIDYLNQPTSEPLEQISDEL